MGDAKRRGHCDFLAYLPRSTRTVALPFGHRAASVSKPVSYGYPTELRTLGDHVHKRRMDLGLLKREVAAIFSIAMEEFSHITAKSGRRRSPNVY